MRERDLSEMHAHKLHGKINEKAFRVFFFNFWNLRERNDWEWFAKEWDIFRYFDLYSPLYWINHDSSEESNQISVFICVNFNFLLQISTILPIENFVSYGFCSLFHFKITVFSAFLHNYFQIDLISLEFAVILKQNLEFHSLLLATFYTKVQIFDYIVCVSLKSNEWIW